MKKYFFQPAALLATLAFTCTTFAQILPAGIALKVVIIRHGEKPKNGDNLNCTGLSRALKLPPVLDTVTGKPDYTYVPTINTGKKTSNVRMFQMVWEHSNIPPLARALVGKKYAKLIQPWLNTDFGSIWIIEFSLSKKNNLKFESYNIEQENITPLPDCN